MENCGSSTKIRDGRTGKEKARKVNAHLDRKGVEAVLQGFDIKDIVGNMLADAAAGIGQRLNKVSALEINSASYAQAIAKAVIRRLAHTQVEEWKSKEEAEVYEVEVEAQEEGIGGEGEEEEQRDQNEIKIEQERKDLEDLKKGII